MPKIVDHAQRRAEIAEALWRVLAREGAEGVSIRSVAAEAGASRGIVEHYFASKDELVAHAYRLAAERTLAKARKRHASRQGREALCSLLLDDLCVLDTRDESARFWLNLLPMVAREPGLAAEFVRFDEAMRAIVAEMIVEMVACGEAASDVDPAECARSAFAFILGMATDLRMRPDGFRTRAGEAQVDAFLDGLAGQVRA